jgi:hypothetical protein
MQWFTRKFLDLRISFLTAKSELWQLRIDKAIMQRFPEKAQKPRAQKESLRESLN